MDPQPTRAKLEATFQVFFEKDQESACVYTYTSLPFLVDEISLLSFHSFKLFDSHFGQLGENANTPGRVRKLLSNLVFGSMDLSETEVRKHRRMRSEEEPLRADRGRQWGEGGNTQTGMRAGGVVLANMNFSHFLHRTELSSLVAFYILQVKEPQCVLKIKAAVHIHDLGSKKNTICFVIPIILVMARWTAQNRASHRYFG